MGNTVGIHIGLSHNIRIDINQQHTECDGHQQQRLIIFFNCQIQEHTGNEDHYVVAPFQVQECGLVHQI